MPPKTSMAQLTAMPTSGQVIAALRKAIPADRLLDILARGALCGSIPEYTIQGDPVPGSETPLAPEARMKVAQYLVDKVMSDAPRLTADVTPADDASLRDATVLRSLPQEQLHALAAPALAALVRASTPTPATAAPSAPREQESGAESESK